jgi:hypothetical protein
MNQEFLKAEHEFLKDFAAKHHEDYERQRGEKGRPVLISMFARMLAYRPTYFGHDVLLWHRTKESTYEFIMNYRSPDFYSAELQARFGPLFFEEFQKKVEAYSVLHDYQKKDFFYSKNLGPRGVGERLPVFE